MYQIIGNTQRTNVLKDEDYLAILTVIRQGHSRDDIVPDLEEILQQPNLINLITDALSIDTTNKLLDQQELARYIKLEALWILSNIAYGDEDHTHQIFEDNSRLVLSIKSLLNNNSNDLLMID